MDAHFMRMAIQEAEKAASCGEVPVGAVLVYQNEVITTAYNCVESRQDATAHAEMLVLRQGAKILNNWRLLDATLYCTLEPCSMCAGAMILSRVKRLVWGAPDIRQGAHGSWVNLLDQPHPIHSIQVTKGVLAEECAELLRSFFRKRREGLVESVKPRDVQKIFEEMIFFQQEKLMHCAQQIIPQITMDDLLQPNDFPALENHPYFRYEEGVLEGLMTARMACRADTTCF